MAEKVLVESVEIEGRKYVLADSVPTAAVVDGLQYVIVRGQASGVFAGFLEGEDGQEVILRQARRLWYWKGAASCSQLAIDGVSAPGECKFPAAVGRVKIKDAIEVLEASASALASIESVKPWKA